VLDTLQAIFVVDSTTWVLASALVAGAAVILRELLEDTQSALAHTPVLLIGALASSRAAREADMRLFGDRMMDTVVAMTIGMTLAASVVLVCAWALRFCTALRVNRRNRALAARRQNATER
jgi:hypothetical protein